MVGREAVVNVRKVVGRVKANGQGQGQIRQVGQVHRIVSDRFVEWSGTG